MSEIKHEKGKEGVRLAHLYLISTLKFDNFWDIYDKSNRTRADRIDGGSHDYDLCCAYIEKFNPLTKRPVYVEVKNYSSLADLGSLYDDFVLRSFSVFLNEQKNKIENYSHYLFFVTHPFYCSKFDELRKMDYIRSLIKKSPNQYGIGGNNKLNEIKEFCSLLWIIIFCREPQELFFHYNRFEIIDYLSRVFQNDNTL